MSAGAPSLTDGEPSDSRMECPSEIQLHAFSTGELSMADLKAVSTHLLRCAKCETKLSSIIEEVERSERTAGREKTSRTPGRVIDSVNSPVGLALVESSGPGNSRGKKNEKGLEPTMPLQLGQYRLIRQIGRGGMGVVYKAWHEKLRREVAVKFLPADQFNDPVGIERMQREMAATGTLRHPNVVYATDAGDAEGVHYLVMEYVAGIDLARLVARLGPLPVADACEVVRQAALGLEHIQAQRMVHRDLKPSNLMLSTDGTVKILDLGLARLRPEDISAEELTRRDYVLGTADYVAPEQADDAHAADIRSDIYSLGCTLYKLLTGEPLYTGVRFDTWTQKIEAHRCAPLPSLGGPGERIPEELQAILRKALAKDVRERYQTPADLAKALAPLARPHHLDSLLRQVDLIPETTTLPPSTPSVSSALAETANFPAPAVAASRPKLSRMSMLLIATGLAAMLTGGISLVAMLAGPHTPKVTDAKEIQINMAHDTRDIRVNPAENSITVNSPDTVIVKLGNLKPKRRHFGVTMEQTKHKFDSWRGHTGIFLGYREEVAPIAAGERARPLGVMQVIYVQESHMPGQVPTLCWHRKLIAVDPDTQSQRLLSKGAVSASFSAMHDQIRLDLEFNERGVITLIKMNGIPMPELTTPAVSADFKPQDCAGPLGIYNQDENGSRFFDIDFSSLESE